MPRDYDKLADTIVTTFRLYADRYLEKRMGELQREHERLAAAYQDAALRIAALEDQLRERDKETQRLRAA